MNDSEHPGDILIVDDTPENLQLLGSLLNARGYRVRPAPSGAFALRAARNEPPELVLLDVHMPGMDGFAVCEQLKADSRLADIPVLFLSAVSETADKLRGFEVGGLDYVTKPFQIEELEARVRTHIHLFRARRLVESQNRQLEAANAAQRELERLRDGLTHMVVHDMRTPLSSIVASLEFLAEDARDLLSTDSRNDIAEAIRGSERLMRMVDDLLDVSRLESGSMPLACTRVDMAELAREVVAGLGAFGRGHEVRIIAADEGVAVECDSELVRRVLENLLANAIKYTPRGTAVRIEVERSAPMLRVAVRDGGPGIPAGQRERIFDKFAQVGHHAGSTPHSSGVGLAFCRLAVDAHGGRIGVECPAEGGSRFWFELPIAQTSVAASDALPATTTDSPAAAASG